jgi:hypothetical protein
VAVVRGGGSSGFSGGGSSGFSGGTRSSHGSHSVCLRSRCMPAGMAGHAAVAASSAVVCRIAVYRLQHV